MKKTISTKEARSHFGTLLDGVSHRQIEYILERKGKPVAALVSVERLEQIEQAARHHVLDMLQRPKADISPDEAEALADEAKHQTRAVRSAAARK